MLMGLTPSRSASQIRMVAPAASAPALWLAMLLLLYLQEESPGLRFRSLSALLRQSSQTSPMQVRRIHTRACSPGTIYRRLAYLVRRTYPRPTVADHAVRRARLRPPVSTTLMSP